MGIFDLNFKNRSTKARWLRHERAFTRMQTMSTKTIASSNVSNSQVWLNTENKNDNDFQSCVSCLSSSCSSLAATGSTVSTTISTRTKLSLDLWGSQIHVTSLYVVLKCDSTSIHHNYHPDTLSDFHSASDFFALVLGGERY